MAEILPIRCKTIPQSINQCNKMTFVLPSLDRDKDGLQLSLFVPRTLGWGQYGHLIKMYRLSSVHILSR